MSASSLTSPQRLANAAPTPSAAPPDASDGRINAVAWRAPDGLEYRDWLLEGRRIGAMSRASQWWIGDWLVYGTAHWGERYVLAAKLTGYDPKSLRNMRYVASRFDLSLRRDDLTFGHHALLASHDPDSQRHWLERASTDRLSVRDLQTELRAELRRDLPSAYGAALSKAGAEVFIVLCPNCGKRVPLPTGVLS